MLLIEEKIPRLKPLVIIIECITNIIKQYIDGRQKERYKDMKISEQVSHFTWPR